MQHLATVSPAKVQVEHPLFLPAEARRRFRDQFHNASVRVEMQKEGIPPRQPALLAATRGHHQHRRRTWAEHVQWYALPDEGRVWVHLAGPASLRTLAGPPDDPGRVHTG